MKTRDELETEGIYLCGPIVPDWFKAQSDGCSVPTRTGRFFLKAEQARAACYIHDFGYYLTALQWEPGTAEWVGARMQADYRLKQNRKLVARWWFAGRVYARLYFRAVRIGGRWAMRSVSELVVPPSPEVIAELESYLRIPITPLARSTIARWSLIYESA